MTLCTLFNVNYLDKGLTLYESLERYCEDFVLYILAMDEKCYSILCDLKYKNIVPIKLEDFEDEQLLKVKPTRSFGEYCWTCTASLILFILKKYQPEYCTYIDADIFFYSTPSYVIEEMKEKNASVQVIGHKFGRKTSETSEKIVGRYCVEFDTFKNDEKGLSLLNIWRNQCLEHCSIDGDGVYWGDQKYQDKWCNDYSFCIETQHVGAGLAPWNISEYRFDDYPRTINVVREGKKGKLVFYHFENIQYIDKHVININVPSIMSCDRKAVRKLYFDYLQLLDEKKDLINSKYGIEVLIKKHPGVVKNYQEGFFKRLLSIFRDRVLLYCNTIKLK